MTQTGAQLRQAFLSFFAQRGHQVVRSSGLIPQNDPTLFFTNAGMVQFKNIFTGSENCSFSRATTSQKCMRVSGKHNDLENVGRTARHHTFFEMLGNFSFGDYFKKEAIALAWEFLTKVLGLPKEKLWVTVFRDDDEAAQIWSEDQNVPADRIVRMDEKDNFWAMGDTGPCGPCSEIHYEQDIPCTIGNTNCAFGKCECDKYLEIWNLVFMQFDRSAGGELKPLPKPSIDTGMGLERLAAVLQGKTSNYDSDLFSPLLKAIQKQVGKTYGHSDSEDDVSMRVLADHIRATSFLIADGVLPSNEGRGYVLRRIMRRAIRHGKKLGQENPFFYKLVETVVGEMGTAYPELITNQETIQRIVRSEEERFFETLDKGLKLLSESLAEHKKRNQKVLDGEVIFKLYDTFGFPPDLTEIMAQENGLSIDSAGFERHMSEQKERARSGWKGSGEEKISALYFDLAEKFETVFLGYDTLESPAKIVTLIQNGKIVSEINEGDAEVILNQTPCYGEGGGQIGDQGLIKSTQGKAFVLDTVKPVSTLFVHQVRLKSGKICQGDTVQVAVKRAVRRPTMRNHTATHIMHAALRKVLGNHVRQAGSLVNEKMLRFDFTHFESISPEKILEIENEVNQVVLDSTPVSKKEMSYDDAIANGALAFFGDKYGDLVRVVRIGDYSVELCGGTHLDSASEIGFFKIVSEGSISAGVRRIEAVTGEEAFKLVQQQSEILKTLSSELKTSSEELPDKVTKLNQQIKTLNKELEKVRAQMLRGGAEDLLQDKEVIAGISVVYYTAQVENPGQLREIADVIMEKLGSGISIVDCEIEGKANVLVSVSKEYQNKFPAKDIIAKINPLIEGRGGGKADRAQAGGTNIQGLKQIKSMMRSLS